MAGETVRLADEEFERWWAETGERELRELLYWAWDPIGVSSSFPYAVDEYDGYAPALVRALRAEASETEIAAMLEAVQRDRMGLGADADLARSATLRILHWYRESLRRWTEFRPVGR
jgi:hypothetical protein